MSAFAQLTPTLRVVLRNPLMGRRYPEDGQVLAVIDTGYEGFAALPKDVFDYLSLDKVQSESRRLTLANGESITSQGAYGAIAAPDLSLSADGFVETYAGLEEVLLGVEALAGARLLLDYCAKRVKVEPCP